MSLICLFVFHDFLGLYNWNIWCNYFFRELVERRGIWEYGTRKKTSSWHVYSVWILLSHDFLFKMCKNWKTIRKKTLWLSNFDISLFETVLGLLRKKINFSSKILRAILLPWFAKSMCFSQKIKKVGRQWNYHKKSPFPRNTYFFSPRFFQKKSFHIMTSKFFTLLKFFLQTKSNNKSELQKLVW